MRNTFVRRLFTALRVWHLLILMSLAPVCSPAEHLVPALSAEIAECSYLLDPQSQSISVGFDPGLPTVIVVDGYSSGRMFAQALRDVGLQIIHVHSTGATPSKFVGQYWPRTYDRRFAYNGNMEALLDRLTAINVVAVIPGTDTGVLLADEISTALNYYDARVRSNGIETARKNKYEMQQRISAHGLDSISQILSANARRSIRWVRANHMLIGQPRVVVKPLASAGGEGVFFPESEAEIREIFKMLVHKEDGLGNVNTKLLTQELLDGVEYVVNSTIWNGREVHTDAWAYNKRRTATGRLIYDYDVLLPYDGVIQAQLRAYNKKVLAALGIRFGNSHSEIKMVKGRGPVLIENNNRPMGSSQPALAKFATGRSQVEMTALALTDFKAFRTLPAAYPLRRHAVVFSIANMYNRRMRLNDDALDELRALPGYFQDLLHVKPGMVAKPTQDMFNSVGEVWLLHEDKALLMRTIDELHAMEQDGRLFSEP